MSTEQEVQDSSARRPRPRDRLLEAASTLFYAEGIRAVGVDRLLVEARVTRATFYRHFSSKDDLILAYLRGRDTAIRTRLARVGTATADPRQKIDLLLGALTDEICGPGFRGCPFINAAAEYADPRHPIRRLIAEHRTWFHDTLTVLAAECGHPDPHTAAAALVLLRDGAMVGGYLDGDRAQPALARAAQTVMGTLA